MINGFWKREEVCPKKKESPKWALLRDHGPLSQAHDHARGFFAKEIVVVGVRRANDEKVQEES